MIDMNCYAVDEQEMEDMDMMGDDSYGGEMD